MGDVNVTMQSKEVAGLQLYYAPEEAETAEIIARACVRSLDIIQERWGLRTPAECRIYVMTSWREFLFHAAPWPWRIAMTITLPIWRARAQALWTVAGGFHQAFGRRRAIGVKPPRLLAEADRTIGQRIFVRPQPRDLRREVRQVTCHELAHACTAHLKPPMWLNEGLAMVTVDHFGGAPTVRDDSLEVLARGHAAGDSARYQDVEADDQEALLDHAVRGYWLTRFLDGQHPDTLRSLLAEPHSRREVSKLLAGAVGCDVRQVWRKIDGIVVNHYRSTVADRQITQDSDAQYEILAPSSPGT